MANIVKDFASPNGPILLLSAKGSTTASIAEADGVKDFSGNGNHGQAYGGVTVVKDVDLGDCFSFDGTGYIEGSTSVSPTSMTFVFLFSYYFTDTQAQSCLINFNPSNRIGGLYLERNNQKIKFYNATSSGSGNYYTNTLFEQNTLYHIVAVSDAVNGLKLYVNGVLDAEYANVYLTHSTTFSYGIGNSAQTGGNKLKGKMSDIRIYPRALSAAEVKYLYNGFQPNLIMGQTIPSGAILDLSARGLTTAGIAQANGVVDRSGNGNHGQAYNGVAVVNDDEMGSCFSFPNNNSYIYLSDKISTIFTQGSAYTYSVSFIVTSKPTRSNGILIMWSFSMPANQIWLTSDYKINVTANADFSAYTASTAVELDKLYTVTVSANYASGVRHIYVNGVLVSTSTRTAGNITLNVTYMILGNHSLSTGYNLPGYIIDARIYPRALTASEVQQLADASLKKVTAVKKGSSEIQRVYYGNNLAYAKTAKHTMTISNDFVRKQLSKTTMGSNSRCVFISPAGNMFATDWSGKCVKIFDSTGTYVRSFTPLSGKIPYAIAGDDTYLYVCYWDSTNIYKYQYSGTDTPTLKATWTAPVTQNDGATVYGGYLYAASQQKQFYRVNLSTGAAETLVTSNYAVNAVEIDTKNNRIVTLHNGGMTTQYVPTYSDSVYARIECYDLSSLTLIKSKILDGSYTSKINNPQGLVVDSNGNLYLGGSYSVNSQYDQGLLVLNDNLEVVHDISSSVCPTFCYSFGHDSYHNRIVWVGSGYGASPYIFGIDIPPVYSLTIE